MTTLLLFSTLATAGDFDHSYAALDRFYGEAVSAAGVDYADLATRRADLDLTLQAIATAPVDSFTADQQLAFYINAYNGWTLSTVLDAMPLDSIFKLDDGKLWDTRRFAVAGQQYTLNQIEHEHVRRLGDARIHAAVNCASVGCPALQPDPFVAERLDAQLDAAARAWVSTNAYRLEGTTVHLSELFNWYADDFPSSGDLPGLDDKAQGAMWFLMAWAPQADKARLKQVSASAWAPYDWSLNAR